MNFSSESVKSKSKPQNEDFCFEIETPRGHFFAVLDFESHDYSNLNTTLKGKLETIVGSFVSLSSFSADLFLGFLAKEINNFLNHLSEQAGGPELLSSAGLCLLDGNRLSYFVCGDVKINLVRNKVVVPLLAAESGRGADRLGARNLESALTDQVQISSLQESDLVLIMTRGIGAELPNEQVVDEISSLPAAQPRPICEALIRASSTSLDDRTLVVVGGPYAGTAEPVLADLSKAIDLLSKRLDALESAQRASSTINATPSHPELSQEID